jgi:hypothetical protein
MVSKIKKPKKNPNISRNNFKSSKILEQKWMYRFATL